MKNGLSKRTYFKQHSKLINGRYTLTSSESDLVYALLTEIKNEDEDFKDYVFSIEDLEKKIGKKINHERLYNTARDLMEKVIEVRKENHKWQLITWFSFFEYDNGMITCTIDKRLKEYLLQLKARYVLSDIRVITQMKSSYSKRIYFLLAEHKKLGTRKFNVKELMDIMQVPKSMQGYAQFKQKVINQAVKEINLYSDIEVNFTEKKMSRKVDSITFEIKHNNSDLKEFIKGIRECQVNEDLYYSPNGRMLKVSKKGILYYKDNLEDHISKEDSEKLWKHLHKNRENLYCYKINLEDFGLK